MIKIVQSPDNENSNDGVKLFIAGGISNCVNWQNELCYRLVNDKRLKTDINIIVFNPRCKSIPEEEPQIKWEYEKLKKSNVISFWFSDGSTNPITLFEYGSHFKSKKTIVVGCHPKYIKINNVIIQTKLVKPKLKVNENFEDFYNDLIDNLIIEISKYKIKNKLK